MLHLVKQQDIIDDQASFFIEELQSCKQLQLYLHYVVLAVKLLANLSTVLYYITQYTGTQQEVPQEATIVGHLVQPHPPRPQESGHLVGAQEFLPEALRIPLRGHLALPPT